LEKSLKFKVLQEPPKHKLLQYLTNNTKLAHWLDLMLEMSSTLGRKPLAACPVLQV
jgi:hypothetical protein